MSQVNTGDDHDDERNEPIEQQMYDPAALGIPYSGRKRVAWLEQLASAVGRAHFCRIIVMPGSTRFYFVGMATDRTIAGNVFGALVRGAIAACDAEYNKARSDPWGGGIEGFRRSFYDGFVNAVANRLRSTRRAADATASTALALRDADSAVQVYMEQQRKSGATVSASGFGGTKRFNRGAYESGKAHGSRASINTAIGGGSRGAIGGAK